jgi:hypothetical protein
MTGLIVAFAFLMLLALWFFPPLFAAGIAVAVLGGIRAEGRIRRGSHTNDAPRFRHVYLAPSRPGDELTASP